MHRSAISLAVFVLGLALCCLNLGLVAMARSSGSGIEYVKACDSGSDDVTNQCINRIPEDVGVNSGNHACAYHEAEIKCLGLCGNTVTWKVAYMNALKRYRLVCANYIDERLAEKEEEIDTGGGESNPPPPPKKKKEVADSGGSRSDPPKAKKNNELDAAKAIAKKALAQNKDAPPQTSPAVAKDKPVSAQSAAVQKTINIDFGKLGAATDQPDDDHKTKQQQKPARNTDDTDSMKRAIKDHAQAMLPTMDPEIAAAPFSATPLTLAASLVVLLVVSVTAF